MRKVLPINLEMVTGRCHDIYRLAAILNYEKYYPWFVERFINLYLTHWFDIFNYKHYTVDQISMYDEILDICEIRDYEEKNIVSKIIETIENDGYVYAVYDFTNNNNGTNFWHDILIYGYDNETTELFFINVGRNRSEWGSRTINYQDFITGFFSGVRLLEDYLVNGPDIDHSPAMDMILHDLPISTFYLKDFDRKPYLPRIYNWVDNYLKGGEYLVEAAKNYGCLTYTERYGISIYKGYYSELLNIITNINPYFLAENNHILSGLKRLYYNKKGLIFRIDYLYKNKMIINDESAIALINKLETLCSKIEKVFELLTKYTFSTNKSILVKVDCLLKESEELDIDIMGQFKHLLLASIRISLFGNKDASTSI